MRFVRQTFVFALSASFVAVFTGSASAVQTAVAPEDAQSGGLDLSRLRPMADFPSPASIGGGQSGSPCAQAPNPFSPVSCGWATQTGLQCQSPFSPFGSMSPFGEDSSAGLMIPVVSATSLCSNGFGRSPFGFGRGAYGAGAFGNGAFGPGLTSISGSAGGHQPMPGRSGIGFGDRSAMGHNPGDPFGSSGFGGRYPASHMGSAMGSNMHGPSTAAASSHGHQP